MADSKAEFMPAAELAEGESEAGHGQQNLHKAPEPITVRYQHFHEHQTGDEGDPQIRSAIGLLEREAAVALDPED